MSRPLLILRPEPDAQSTARRAEELGLEAMVHPLFSVEPVPWNPPPADAFDALMLTSANALRHGGPALAAYAALRTYSVGERTAQAARKAGFADVHVTGPDGASVIAALERHGHRHVLHLAGEAVRAHPPGDLSISRLTVYRTVEAGSAMTLAPLLARAPIALLHSPRAAERLASLVPLHQRGAVSLVAISPAALASAGGGWSGAHSTETPSDSAMLAIAARMCQ